MIPIESEKGNTDTDGGRHFKRVLRYTRKSDWAAGGTMAVALPTLMLVWERVSPSYAGKGALPPMMRLSGAVSTFCGFILAYQRSISQYPLNPLDDSTDCSHSAILWLQRKRTRERDGYARDGR